MKVVAVIPARYNSSRFPGKPLVDIAGKPMISWVYDNVSKSKKFDNVYIATDDSRIEEVCKKNNMNYVMTSADHSNHISRIWEVSNMIEADFYICVNGDEPLIDYKMVEEIIPKEIGEVKYFQGAYRVLNDPAEVVDPANIKIVLNKDNRCIYMSRIPVPFPKGTLAFKYYKYVGIECFTKEGLNLFNNNKMGEIEKVEDIDHLRFLENDCDIYFKEINSNSISVDTPKDLEKVIELISDGKNK